MFAFCVTGVIGIVCIVMGVINMRGNISTLHSYHRHRVSEEDVIPFGKMVGLGTIIIGCAIIIFSVLSAIAVYVDKKLFLHVANAILVLGIISGCIISFKAMIKYNNGIF